ncbi:MAG: FAD-linked oxidase C-terminal domain-containing protein, partial [Flavobacteriaceae bacterium]|nr:FAD-linked oxidase C-terminal domain-containing protein [Flavobacteriaceae bacterium]
QTVNRQFIVKDPQALLMLQLNSNTEDDLMQQVEQLQSILEQHTAAYAQPVLYGDDIEKALELRKAGLGLLGNIKGDKKAVPCIEDTAVRVIDLADYIAEFTEIMQRYGQKAVYYAHAGAGELHLRPLLNLKEESDQKLFQQITSEVAELVKKYRGSMSGEHGDGIVRGGFVQNMIGEHNYDLLQQIKASFDPHRIFNPGKIVQAYPMLENLRFQAYKKNNDSLTTGFSFEEDLGYLSHIEKCNGSGDCLKSGIGAAMMCPSYHVSRKETDTTRGRANALREMLSTTDADTAFRSDELEQVMDLCIGCKACKTECPSSVDMALLKSEYLFQKHRLQKPTKKAHQFGFIHRRLKQTASFAPIVNWANKSPLSKLIKYQAGIHPKRSLPDLNTKNLLKYLQNKPQQPRQQKTVYLFLDEFTKYIDYSIGKASIDLLIGLGYSVKYLPHPASGRALISKGFLKEAKTLAEQNIALFYPILNENHFLVGIEPSAILSFVDEYPRLCNKVDQAKQVAQYCRTIDRFIYEEFKAGNISPKNFTKHKKDIHLHVHCHQKSLDDYRYPLKALSIPENYTVQLIPSGCCGMAGSFGMEKEHYDFSLKIAEQRLFPFLRNLPAEVEVAATGHSCRHQIKDGLNKTTKHPVEFLSEALLN